jgi:murein DD-endopeptidase MepM/ murein hydrolase activator NlpD
MGVYAQNVNDRTRQRKEIERDIEVINKQLASVQAQQQASVRGLSLLQQKIASRKLLLVEIGVQVRQINDSINKRGEEVKALQTAFEGLEFLYLEILYKAYTHRNRQVWVAYLLASDNLRQAYHRWQYFKDFSRYMNRQAEQMKWTSAHLDNEINVLKRMRTEVEELKGVQQKELATMNQEERQSKQMIAEMSRQEGKYRTQLQQKQKDLAKINKEIAQMLAQAEKNRKAASAKELEIDRALAANFEQNKGKLAWPVGKGVVTAPYGQHNHPVLKGIKMPFNNGVGISGSRGDEVFAVFQGIVKKVVFISGYNQCILIQHGSYYTFYCKLGTVKVKTGDSVATGDVLGTLAEIDGEYALHFEVWNGTTKQNPELWLRKR